MESSKDWTEMMPSEPMEEVDALLRPGSRGKEREGKEEEERGGGAGTAG